MQFKESMKDSIYITILSDDSGILFNSLIYLEEKE